MAALSFLQASVSCALSGLAVWALARLALRAWPALAMQRAVWLLAQAAIGAAFVLALLPHSARLSVLPVIELAHPLATPFVPALTDELVAAGALAEQPGSALLPLLAQAWLALYCAGLLLAVARWLRARRLLRQLLASACRLDAHALAAHAGFDGARDRRLPVYETDAAISPMLVGLAQPLLLLPRHLRRFSDEQQQLIVAHELTHLQRRDPLWLHVSLALQTVFWFCPGLRALGRQLNWAQELGCDQQVLAGRPVAQRRQYAAALAAQLALQRCVSGASLAFGDANGASLAGRVRLIRHNAMAPAGAMARGVVGAALAALLGAGVLLQPAFAWRADVAELSVGPALPASWRAPLDRVRVTSFYGTARKNLADGHHGIDFAARSGTPVLATGAGVVVASTDLYEGGAKYGKVIVIEHAGGLRSLYAHLERRSVQVGARVGAGQAIGLSGATGRVTGPHLHLEAFQGEQRIDPQQLISGLDAFASATALRTRRAN
ncbi:MAG: M56 family metallopeptidase [Pseudomonadota bacterium]